MKGKLGFHDFWPLLKQTGSEWLEDKATKMAGALAYYSATSIAPMLVIAVWLATRFFGSEAPDKLRGEIASLTDRSVAAALQEAISRGYQNHSGALATVMSLVIGVASASCVFAELQDSLNTIWEVRPKPNRGFMGIVKDRFLSMTAVLGIAFLLLVSTVLSAVISTMSSQVMSHTVGSSSAVAQWTAFAIDLVLSTSIITVLFAAMFKWLPDATISWGDVWLGGFVTAVLFEIGKYLLSFYIGHAAPGSAFGAVGSIVVMLIWVFYSAQILFFGAEFTQVYANSFGTHIVPASNAEPLTEEMREQAGIPHSPTVRKRSPSGPRAMILPTRRRRAVVRPVSTTGKSAVEWGVPAIALITIARFAWKRLSMLKTRR
jgi:membrane protein